MVTKRQNLRTAALKNGSVAAKQLLGYSGWSLGCLGWFLGLC